MSSPPLEPLPFPEKTSGRLWLAVLLILLVCAAGVRLVRIEADAPPLPNQFRNVAPYKDEGEKAYEARNRVLFGDWQINPQDNFNFWHVQSPVWTYGLVAVFKTLGVGCAPMRLLSILCAMITLAAGAILLRREGHAEAALCFVAVLGFNFYYLFFTRLGLMEPMVIVWVTLMVLCLTESRHRPAWMIPATVLLVAGIFTKQSALLALPIWAGYLIAPVKGPSDISGKGKVRRSWPLLTACGLILALPLVLAILHPTYRALTVINFEHGFHLTRAAKAAPLITPLRNVLASLAPRELWRGYFMMLPAASILGMIWSGWIWWRALKRRPVSGLEWALLAWFIIGRAAAVVTSHQVVRFHLFYFAPLAALAALALEKLWRGSSTHVWNQRAGRLLVAGFLLYECLMTVVPWQNWARHPRYDLVQGSRLLGEKLAAEETELGRPPVLIGEWVGPLSLENTMRCHYVKAYYNQSAAQLAAFGITHLLENQDKDDPAITRFQRLFPEAYAARRPVADFRVRGRHLRLWRVPPVSAASAATPAIEPGSVNQDDDDL